jgi:glycosyltransferase involved in cell wall biosynthesis
MLSATRDPRPRVLHVLHSPEGGGTEKHVQDLTASLSSQFLSFRAAPWETLKLCCGDVTIGEWSYTPADWPLSASNLPENDAAWLAILDQIKPDLIHFHHLLRHPLSLLAKLTATGIPVITSIHDYYFLCPDYTLQFCPGIHSCETCFPKQFKGPAEYQVARRALLGGSLRQASALVAPSQFTADLVREVYPDLNIRVIPHGIREIQRLPQVPSSKLRFGMVGTVSLVKGIELITQVWPLVAHGGAAELHVYGDSDPKFIQLCEKAGIHFHGPYREADLPGILAQIDIGVLPSQAPETFCYALSEFFAGGVPVVGSDYGALADRIYNGVNGLKVPRDNPQAWVDALSRLVQDSALREKIARGVRAPNLLDQMAARYSALYHEVLTKQRTLITTQDKTRSEQPVPVGA